MIVSAIQMVSTADLDVNLNQAEQLIKEAVRRQAKLVVLPENFARIASSDSEHADYFERFGQGKIQSFLANLAKTYSIVLVAGTVPLSVENNPSRVSASCLVYDEQGSCCARYDKIHLFNVTIPETGESYCESKVIVPGNRLETVTSSVGKLGLSVCYDLRFPELYRRLAEFEAELFPIPAAFTDITGQAHWEVLVRARAIENLAYVVAANQGGLHENQRLTYGNSMIVDPWGKVLVRLEKGPGVIAANISLADLKKIRSSFPVLAGKVLAIQDCPEMNSER